MILSSRICRPLHRALKLGIPRDPDWPGQDDGLRDAEARPRRDPDWVIREIVDEIVFETAR